MKKHVSFKVILFAAAIVTSLHARAEGPEVMAWSEGYQQEATSCCDYGSDSAASAANQQALANWRKKAQGLFADELIEANQNLGGSAAGRAILIHASRMMAKALGDANKSDAAKITKAMKNFNDDVRAARVKLFAQKIGASTYLKIVNQQLHQLNVDLSKI